MVGNTHLEAVVLSRMSAVVEDGISELGFVFGGFGVKPGVNVTAIGGTYAARSLFLFLAIFV